MWTLYPRLPIPLWRPAGATRAAIAAFTTRRGGGSLPPYDSLNLGRSTTDLPEAVDANRDAVLERLGLAPDRLATAGQVHGVTVTRVVAPGVHPECDALLTTRPGLALAVSGADCLPILIEAPGAVAAAHSGWRGTAAGIPAAALRALCEAAGVGPDQVLIAFGPCIRACCYEVSPEVADRFPAAAVSRVEGRLRLDVPAAARLQLLAAGVPAASLADVGACTACGPEGYFSHRRDRGFTGRQWGVIALPA